MIIIKNDYGNWEGIYANLSDNEKDLCNSIVRKYNTREEYNAYFKSCTIPSRKLLIVIGGMLEEKFKNLDIYSTESNEEVTIEMPRDKNEAFTKVWKRKRND